MGQGGQMGQGSQRGQGVQMGQGSQGGQMWQGSQQVIQPAGMGQMSHTGQIRQAEQMGQMGQGPEMRQMGQMGQMGLQRDASTDMLREEIASLRAQAPIYRPSPYRPLAVPTCHRHSISGASQPVRCKPV